MDWLEALQTACDESGQAAVGRQLNYSKTAVSQVLNSKYPGNLPRFKERVEAMLMKRSVECPLLGDISLSVCMEHQKRKLSVTNPMRVQMYRACRSQCPHSKVCKEG